VRELLEQGAALEAPLKKKLTHFGLGKGLTILPQARSCHPVPSLSLPSLTLSLSRSSANALQASCAIATKDAMHDASRTEIVSLLLQRGADPLRRSGDQGLNSMWYAMVGGNLETIDLLLKKCPALLTTNVALFGEQ